MGELSQEDIRALEEGLASSRSAKRRSAAKRIGKAGAACLGRPLLEAYLKERKDPRTWETQAEMIRALGKVGCKETLPYLRALVQEDRAQDTVTAMAALSYIRLARTDTHDMEAVLDLLRHGGPSVFDGAAMAMAYDDMVPTREQMEEVLQILDERREVYERPYSDPIQLLISAMRCWPPEVARPFLERYENTRYGHFVKNTLAGKKSAIE